MNPYDSQDPFVSLEDPLITLIRRVLILSSLLLRLGRGPFVGRHDLAWCFSSRFSFYLWNEQNQFWDQIVLL